MIDLDDDHVDNESFCWLRFIIDGNTTTVV